MELSRGTCCNRFLPQQQQKQQQSFLLHLSRGRTHPATARKTTSQTAQWQTCQRHRHGQQHAVQCASGFTIAVKAPALLQGRPHPAPPRCSPYSTGCGAAAIDRANSLLKGLPWRTQPRQTACRACAASPSDGTRIEPQPESRQASSRRSQQQDAAASAARTDSWLALWGVGVELSSDSSWEDGGREVERLTDEQNEQQQHTSAALQEQQKQQQAQAERRKVNPARRWPPSEEQEEENEMRRRFKLRNGREILEERAYLVGVELQSPSFAAAVTPSRRRAMRVHGALDEMGGANVQGQLAGQLEGGGARAGAAAAVVFPVEESLAELAQLCDTAGLRVVGHTAQRLATPNPRTYIGAGKVEEVKAAIAAFDVETVVLDDELSPGQLRNLEKEFGKDVRVCDRTALILDIFSQRAATKEAALQVELAQVEYQLPRLTRMWTHLERQAGGLVKGMGEKQIEVDKRLLRDRVSVLRRSLRAVQGQRKQHREKRASVPIPVISLVGYTNAGKSTLMNRLCSSARVLAEDQLFATLDPTTRRLQLPQGKEVLLTDTVGFIQKLPTQLVAAFRATLEEIGEASILMHVVDVSHPMAAAQVATVEQVLEDLDVTDVPVLTVLNKVDCVDDSLQLQQLRAALSRRRRGSSRTYRHEQEQMHEEKSRTSTVTDPREGRFTDSGRGGSAAGQGWKRGRGVLERGATAGPGSVDVATHTDARAGMDAWVAAEREEAEMRFVEVSALTGQGMATLLLELEDMVNSLLLVAVEAIIPFSEGHLLSVVYRLGAVTHQDHRPAGTYVAAHVPRRLAMQLLPYRRLAAADGTEQAGVAPA